VAYKEKHKSASVPTRYVEDPELGQWVMTQRVSYIRNEISEERINHLESIGFVWGVFDVKWMGMYQKLVTYKKEYNSTRVPAKYKEDPKLGNWVVVNQRKHNNHTTLSVERINRLESIGFFWNPLDAQWMEMDQKLVAYKKQHRSTYVPQYYMKDPQLGKWVYLQRYIYRENNLTEKRMERLNSVDFAWSAI
jgi:hypothetical protein